MSGRLRFAINLGNAVLTTSLKNEPAGITVDLARKLAAALHSEAQLVTYPAAGKVVEDAGNDRWDIAFLAVDPQREETLGFSQPYITIQGTALVRADSRWQSVTQMDEAGVTVNVGKGAAYDLHLTRQLQHASLNRLGSSQEAIAAFLRGEGDMAAGIRQPLERVARENKAYRVLADNFGAIDQAICVPRQRDQLLPKISQLLAQWQNDNSLGQIIDRHLAGQ